MFAQYFPAADSSKMIELTPTELAEPTSFRSSRSDNRKIAKSPSSVDHGVDVQAEVAAAAVPCKAVVADRSLQSNDTSSTNTVEKLSAFYEQLKSQQEALARQQFEQQLYEQQKRRQEQFTLIQHQIQQQYYQQQQQAILMLDQMRKNPAFASQLSAYVDHKAKSMAQNGTSEAAALPVVVPEVTASVGAKRSPKPQEKDKTNDNHMAAEQDNSSEDSGAKRVDAKQVARQKVFSSDRKQHPVAYDEDNDYSEDDTPSSFEDEETRSES